MSLTTHTIRTGARFHFDTHVRRRLRLGLRIIDQHKLSLSDGELRRYVKFVLTRKRLNYNRHEQLRLVTIVYNDEHRPVGTAVVFRYTYLRQKPPRFIIQLYIKPKYRRLGVGSALYERCRRSVHVSSLLHGAAWNTASRKFFDQQYQKIISVREQRLVPEQLLQDIPGVPRDWRNLMTVARFKRLVMARDGVDLAVDLHDACIMELNEPFDPHPCIDRLTQSEYLAAIDKSLQGMRIFYAPTCALKMLKHEMRPVSCTEESWAQRHRALV